MQQIQCTCPYFDASADLGLYVEPKAFGKDQTTSKINSYYVTGPTERGSCWSVHVLL